MRRTADLVYDDSGDSLFLRKIDTQPCIIYKYKVLANDWQLCTQYPPSCYRFSMAYHNHLMIIGGAMSQDDKATRSAEIQSLVDGTSWKHKFSDMPTSRSRSTALTCCVNQVMLLIVIGGEDDSDATLKTVEMLDMTNPRNAWKKSS